MLSLKNITKRYRAGDFTQTALNGVSLHFRENEFVAVLGPSGSGKTTLLNVIGGLDRYDSGDLIINGRSTKDFSNTDWDAYRNNSIGFVFQTYNLIPHLSVVDNVEMGMTLSGVPSEQRKKKALEVLEKVGLKEHIHKNPNQLSGGQMQRVAIARALVNDPDIILADEPTGALDSKTSIQIMDLMKEVAKDKLVILVTHNAYLAKKYADRIIELKDGEVISDSRPAAETETRTDYRLKKTKMSFFTALKLSANNIRTKKGRTLLTAFASSIGIIGIAVILAISNGFDKKIDEFEAEALSTFPIMITPTAMEIDPEAMEQHRKERLGLADEGTYPEEKAVFPVESIREQITHQNILTEEYTKYVENIDPELISGISYGRALKMNLLKKDGDEVALVNTENGFTSYPLSLGDDEARFLKESYDVLAGSYPKNERDLVLVVDKKNGVDKAILRNFGFNAGAEEIDFDTILNKEYKVILNDEFYKNIGGLYTMNHTPDELAEMYDSEHAITLKVKGILRPKETVDFPVLEPGFVFSDKLAETIIADAKNSDVVQAQEEADYHVLTGETFDLTNPEDIKNKELTLAFLGGNSIPQMISIYPRNFAAKDEVLNYLDEYNEGKEDEDKIIYTDLAGTLTEMSGGILKAVTYVLVAFSAISLVVSVMMIAIITYISVIERTKEIGILRSLGARKKDISRVFNAETFIIGLAAGIIGIAIARLAVFPINNLLERLTDLPDVAKLNPLHAILLVLVSLTLTILGGAIPARMASQKDPVEALRTE